MRIILDVKDSKAEFVLELLDNLSFVKAERLPQPKKARKVRQASALSAHKKQVQDGIRQAVKELVLVKKGKLKTRTLQEFLDEL